MRRRAQRTLHRERTRRHTVIVVRFYQRLDVVGVSARLGSGNESCPNPGSGRARSQNGGEQPRRADATGRQDWNAHYIEDCVEELEQREPPPYMPSRLSALGDNQVAAGILRRLGLVHRPDLPRHQSATLVCPLDEVSTCVTPEKSIRRTCEETTSTSSTCSGMHTRTFTARAPGVTSPIPSMAGPARSGPPSQAELIVPNPPARATAAANSVLPIPIPANWMGAPQPTSLVNLVASIDALPS